MPKIKKYLSEISELIEEWHPTLNGDLSPGTLTHKSGKKVWWSCEKQHAYQAIVANRNKGDKSTGCPYCVGKKATPENCLASLSPNISKEWHPKKRVFLNRFSFEELCLMMATIFLRKKIVCSF